MMKFIKGGTLDFSAIVSAIKTFSIDCGWSVNGNVISKNGCHTRIQMVGTGVIEIVGAGSADFTKDYAGDSNRMAVFKCDIDNVSNYEYFLFGYDQPDYIHCVIRWNGVNHQHLAFGNVKKYITEENFKGGSFYYATASRTAAVIGDWGAGGLTTGKSVLGLAYTYIYNDISKDEKIIPLKWSNELGDNYSQRKLGVIAGINNLELPESNKISTIPRTILYPINILGDKDIGNFFAFNIGVFAHVLARNIRNINSGDEITNGEQKYMVFPVLRKQFNSQAYMITGSTTGGIVTGNKTLLYDNGGYTIYYNGLALPIE